MQLKEAKKAYIKQSLNMARNVLDLPVIFHFMDYKGVGVTQAGILGAATSAISLFNMWNPQK